MKSAYKQNQPCTDIFTAVHYPITLNLQPAFAHLNKTAGRFPLAEEMVGRVMSLPMGAMLTCNEQQRIVDALTEAVAIREATA